MFVYGFAKAGRVIPLICPKQSAASLRQPQAIIPVFVQFVTALYRDLPIFVGPPRCSWSASDKRHARRGGRIKPGDREQRYRQSGKALGAKRGGGFGLWLVSTSDGSANHLASDEFGDPSFSPDGHHLVALLIKDPDHADMYVLDLP